MDSRKCDWCGKEFIPKNKRNRFCGVSCQVKNKDYVKSQYGERRCYNTCENCGKMFYTITKMRTLCLNCERAAASKSKRFTYAEIVAKNRANPIKSGWRGQMRIAAWPALRKFE